MTERLKKVLGFIKENYDSGIQVYFTRNIVGDYMDVVYQEDGITIEYCPVYWYLEVFGLTNKEQAEFEGLLKGLSEFYFKED
jgi:tRNA(His) 5'-end guanylyltransferase